MLFSCCTNFLPCDKSRHHSQIVQFWLADCRFTMWVYSPFRAALLGYDAARQHHHLIRTGYGTHPMGDDKDGFVLYEPRKSLLNGSFVLHV